MVATALSPELMQEGESLLKELDAAKVPVNAALWFFFPEQSFWKLLLALPDADKDGPKAAYEKI